MAPGEAATAWYSPWRACFCSVERLCQELVLHHCSFVERVLSAERSCDVDSRPAAAASRRLRHHFTPKIASAATTTPASSTRWAPGGGPCCCCATTAATRISRVTSSPFVRAAPRAGGGERGWRVSLGGALMRRRGGGWRSSRQRTWP